MLLRESLRRGPLGRKVRGLFPLRKAVVFLRRIVEIQRRANSHYLRALAAVENPARAYELMNAMGQPVVRKRPAKHHLTGDIVDVVGAAL